jgi:lysylphosphatidylglycerol synthetase-like protein (DUF2156 family)
MIFSAPYANLVAAAPLRLGGIIGTVHLPVQTAVLALAKLPVLALLQRPSGQSVTTGRPEIFSLTLQLVAFVVSTLKLRETSSALKV